MNQWTRACGGLVAAILILLGHNSAAWAGDVHGRVVDADSGVPLAAVNVAVPALARATISDGQGHFRLRGVPAGAYELRISRIGYEQLMQQVDVDGQALMLVLTPMVLRLREMTVTPGAFRFMDSKAPAPLQTLTREDIEGAPQFSDDIFRAIHRLPGLSAGDFGARFGIRGGRDDETLILIDGLEVYEPYHMKDFNEGAISIVDVAAIDGVELMTGGFPVRYGNRRSGVFHIHSRQPRADSPQVQATNRHSVGLSLMNLRAQTEGLFGDGRGSWFVSARRGYLDLVFSLMNLNDLPAPTYYDVFSKVTWDLTPAQNLSVRLLHAGDSFDVDQEATTGFQDTIDARETVDNRYGNSYLWATLTSTLSPKVTVETMVNAGLVTHRRAGAEIFLSTPGAVYEVDKSRDLRITGIKQDWTVEPTDAWLWLFGADLRGQNADFRLQSLVYQDPNDPSEDPLGLYPVATNVRGDNSSTLLGAYAANRVQLAPPLTVEGGVRYDRASHTGDSDFSPRVSAMIDLPTNSLLRLGWGQYRQFHDLHEETALHAGSQYAPSELSTQLTAGIEHVFGGTGIRIEAYHKHSSNPRPVYRNWVAGALDVFPETNEDLVLVDVAETTARGIEAYVSHDNGGRLALRGSYALAHAWERLHSVANINVPESPIRFADENDVPRDQRHAVSLDLIWRPGSKWTVDLALAYHSGWPITLATPEATVRPDGEPDVAARPEVLYSSRLPAYQRIDVRCTRRIHTEGGDLRVFLELINLANRENVFAYDYEKDIRDDGTRFLAQDTESWFPLLPSIGMSWSW